MADRSDRRVQSLPELPLSLDSNDWVYVESADPLLLELARRGAEYVIGVVAAWVGWEYCQVAWEHRQVIQVEDRYFEWQVIVQRPA